MDQPLGGDSSQQTLLVVAGSGRSGTSLFTGLTGRLGLYIPQPELKPNDSNPRGFGEPKWAIVFHKELLRSVDVSHDDGRPEAWDITTRVADRKRVHERLRRWLDEQFSHSDRVVVKDPRLAWFVKLYGNVVDDLSAQLCVVTMLRHPVETVLSKHLAYGGRSDGTTRMAGWLNMMLSTEHRTRHLPRAIVRYDGLLDDWRAALTAAEGQLPLGLVSAATPEQLADADGLVDVSLRRAGGDWSVLDLPEPLRLLAERAYESLGKLADGTGPPAAAQAELDVLRGDFADSFREAEALARSSLKAAAATERRKLEKIHKQALQEAVAKARQEAEAKVRQEAEAKVRQEAEAKVRQEAEAKAVAPEPSLVTRVRRRAGSIARKVRA